MRTNQVVARGDRRKARRCRGEDGVSLLLAIGFLAFAGLFIPTLLTLGTTNLLATSRLQEQRGAVYAADGATDAALQYLRSHLGCGRPFQVQGTGSGQCPSPPYTGSTTTSYTLTINNQTATTVATAVGNVLDFDRTVTLSTSVGGVTRVTAKAIIRDSQATGGTEAPIDVVSWTYDR
jgi:hypothetical protein